MALIQSSGMPRMMPPPLAPAPSPPPPPPVTVAPPPPSPPPVACASSPSAKRALVPPPPPPPPIASSPSAKRARVPPPPPAPPLPPTRSHESPVVASSAPVVDQVVDLVAPPPPVASSSARVVDLVAPPPPGVSSSTPPVVGLVAPPSAVASSSTVASTPVTHDDPTPPVASFEPDHDFAPNPPSPPPFGFDPNLPPHRAPPLEYAPPSPDRLSDAENRALDNFAHHIRFTAAPLDDEIHKCSRCDAVCVGAAKLEPNDGLCLRASRLLALFS